MKRILVFSLFLSIALLVASFLILEKDIRKINHPFNPDYEFRMPGVKKTIKEKTTVSAAEKESAAIAAEARKCEAAAYGLDCGIVKYLEGNMAAGAENGIDFCSYEVLAADGRGKESYLYALCQKFVLYGKKIYESGNKSGPVALTEIFGGGYLSRAPRDGNYFYADLAKEFPVEILPTIQNYSIEKFEKLSAINKERAKVFFEADFDYAVEKILDKKCSKDFECSTPGEYLAMSRCPFAAMCLENKCAVVCPRPNPKVYGNQ